MWRKLLLGLDSENRTELLEASFIFVGKKWKIAKSVPLATVNFLEIWDGEELR